MVDQSRVLLTLLAVMARNRVTQGACWRVPISGQYGPVLTGQGTCLMHVATGAARSEPSGPRAPPGRAPWHIMCGPAGVVRVLGVPGVAGCQGQSEARALHRCRRVHIQGYHKARLGQGRCQKLYSNSTRTSARTSARTMPDPTPGTRHIRHPTSDTRHPTPPMYPGYLVTQCRP